MFYHRELRTCNVIIQSNYAHANNDSILLILHFTKEDHRLVGTDFICYGDDYNHLEVYYNSVQLIGKQLKQAMSELEPLQLKYYVGDSHQYMTSSGVGIYIDNQAHVPGIDDNEELSWESMEHLLHCPICGAGTESDFFDKCLKETGVPQESSSWCVFDTTKDSWFDCRALGLNN